MWCVHHHTRTGKEKVQRNYIAEKLMEKMMMKDERRAKYFHMTEDNDENGTIAGWILLSTDNVHIPKINRLLCINDVNHKCLNNTQAEVSGQQNSREYGTYICTNYRHWSEYPSARMLSIGQQQTNRTRMPSHGLKAHRNNHIQNGTQSNNNRNLNLYLFVANLLICCLFICFFFFFGMCFVALLISGMLDHIFQYTTQLNCSLRFYHEIQSTAAATRLELYAYNIIVPH